MPAVRYTLRRLADVDDHAFQVRTLVDGGACAFDDYAADLQLKQRSKIKDYLAILAEKGSGGFGTKQQIEHCGGGTWELKPGYHRLLLFRVGQVWIIVDAFSKNGLRKKDQTARIDAVRDVAYAYVYQQMVLSKVSPKR